GLATDDAHGYHAWGLGKVNPGRGWVMVKAPHPTAEAIVKAIEAGDFYASTGVTLNPVFRTKEYVQLHIEVEPGVTYTTQFIATMKDANLDSKEQLDMDGKPVPVTNLYSAEIGKVVQSSVGTFAQ